MSFRVKARGAEIFTQRVQAFTEDLRRRDEQTSKLLGPRTELGQDPAMLQEALEELRFHHDATVLAEEELRTQLDELTRLGLRIESERARYVDLFEHAPDPYLVTDGMGVIRDANAAAVGLFGLEYRFLRGKPLAGFLERGHGIHAALDKLTRSGEALGALECTVLPRGGDPVAVVARVSLSARESRLLWSLRRVAPAAAERTTSLERSLRDKDELLARERRERETLQRSNDAKDRFIAVLSHDLRSPLNAILGWVQLLRREVLDSGARARAHEKIERNALVQASLIDGLLDISRMATARFPFELVPVAVSSLVTRVVEGEIPAARANGVEIVVTTVEADAALTVLGDARRIEQIVVSLLANAMRFTTEGGRIEVGVVHGADLVDIVVRDDGRGVAPERLPRIFEIDAKDDPASIGGASLGLYIVKRLAELQLGSVRAESEGVGKGATFTVSLPRRTERPANELPVPRRPDALLAGIHVLVVDDDPDARELMVTVLGRANATVQWARNAAQALAICASEMFDVVVSDLAMPEVDGTDLLARLRAIDPGIAAIAVSGYATREDGERALAAGFDIHLAKPTDMTELVAAVHEASRLRHR